MRLPAIRLLAPWAAILLALVSVSCGDSGGPEEAPDFSGTYSGEFYIIASSSSPAADDSMTRYPVTLTLARQGEELYEFSSTNASRGLVGTVQIISTGGMGFPELDLESIRNHAGSFLAGFCDVSTASVAPAGEVRRDRLTFLIHTVDASCDWGAGTGSADVRRTRLRLTWTGTRS